LKSIEDQIRDKKAELKAKSRELSALQNELKKKNGKQWYKVISEGTARESRNKIDITVASNKSIDAGIIRSAIESLSDTPSEPKSYVNWKDKRLDGYNWAAVDPDGRMGVFVGKPSFAKEYNHWTTRCGWKQLTPEGPLPSWDKSLIHRPGAKE